MNSNLPLGQILDVEKRPIINKKYVLVFIIGFLFGISVGVWTVSHFERDADNDFPFEPDVDSMTTAITEAVPLD